MHSTGLESGLDEEHLLALGRIAYWASRTEGILREIAEYMVRGRIGPRGDVLNTAFRGAGYGELEGLVLRLVDRADDYGNPEIKYIKSGLAIAKVAMEMRNTLFHGEWVLPADGPGISHPTAVMGKRSGKEPNRSQQFDMATADNVSEVVAEAAEILAGVYLLVDGSASLEELHGDQRSTRTERGRADEQHRT